MADFVGIVRTEERLCLALERVCDIKTEVDDYYEQTPATYYLVELHNMTLAAELVVRSALQRKESRGLHFIEDYPEARDEACVDTVLPGLKRHGESKWPQPMK